MIRYDSSIGGHDMLKKITAVFMTVLTAFAALTGCSFDPGKEEVDLYGPVPDVDINENWVEESAEETITTLYGPPPTAAENPAWEVDDAPSADAR